MFERLPKNTHLPFDRLTALSFSEGLRCACHLSLPRMVGARHAVPQQIIIAYALYPEIIGLRLNRLVECRVDLRSTSTGLTVLVDTLRESTLHGCSKFNV
jgi:hypothetical protein